MRYKQAQVKIVKAFTTNAFIEKAKLVHGDKYDYSQSQYVSARAKVKIICAFGHAFLQSPDNHLRNHGCPECVGLKKSNTNDFIKKAIVKHGDKFDYSLAEYVSAIRKVKIICRKAGHSFMQTPNDHLNGYGCAQCALAGRWSDTSHFVEKAIAKHGDRFDYSRVKYVRSRSKVEIICDIGHVFFQEPRIHLNNGYCPKCVKPRSNPKSNTNEFIEKAIAKHGEKFDYSEVEYINAVSKVQIICRKAEHSFLQVPSSHLQGRGCRQCRDISMSGENSYNWNPARTNEERESRRKLQNLELHRWRGAVFGRDNKACQKCHEVGREIHAHHILPWSKFPEVRFDVDNGITFCKSCHQRYHSAYRLAECNHKTIAEFLSLSETK